MFDWAKFRTAKGFKKYTRAGMTIVKFGLSKYNRSKNTQFWHRSVSFKGTIIVEDRAYFDFIDA
jgi:hypothetical protein